MAVGLKINEIERGTPMDYATENKDIRIRPDAFLHPPTVLFACG